MRLSENIGSMWRATRGSRGAIMAYSLLGVVSIVVSLAVIWITKSLVDMAIQDVDAELINRYVVLLVAAIVFQQLISIFRTRISNYASVVMMNRQRSRLFTSVMRSAWIGTQRRHTGDVVNRIESDSRTLSEALCITIPSIVVTLVQMLAAFRFLQLLDARLSWIIIAIMPISLILSKRFLFTMRDLTQAIRSTDSSIQSHIQEQIQNREVVNTIGDIERSSGRLTELGTTLLGETMRRVNYTLFSRTAVQVGFGAGYVTALVWGIYGLKSGAVTFGMMTAFLQLVAQIQRPAVDLATQISAVAKSIASMDRLHEIESLEQELSGEQVALDGAVGVRATELDFEYSDGVGRKILTGFSYDFEPRRLHIIVGYTGVGKSTLVRLMLGILKPSRGTIEIYNREGSVAECSPLSRSNFVYVPQGNTLLSGTVRENLLLAKPTATESEILEVLRIAVAEFVLDLPQGLDTPCAERGVGLSEGEAQRIAIARGLLQSGSIMLLDEPTSALDPQTEELLLSRLSKAAEHKTLIMVTHRSHVAQQCG